MFRNIKDVNWKIFRGILENQRENIIEDMSKADNIEKRYDTFCKIIHNAARELHWLEQ